MRTATSYARAVTIPRSPGPARGPEPATVGDHITIEQFLAAVFQAPSPQEFQAQLEDPFYEPSDRLIVKRGRRVAGHVMMNWRTMCFGGIRWPLCQLSYLGVLPECSWDEIAPQLLATAEQLIQQVEGVVAELDVRLPYAERCGQWAAVSHDVCSQASPRDILAELVERAESQPQDVLPAKRDIDRRLSVRLWRHVELAALMRIYEANLPTLEGALERSEAYWRWLIGRRAFDQIFIAIEGRDKLSLEEDGCRIVGYAVAKKHEIVELLTEPGHPTAAAQLLARACADAIEHDRHAVRLHAPPGYPLHEIIRKAGGSYHPHAMRRGMAKLVRLFSPAACIRQLGDHLQRRAKAASLRSPTELGLAFDGGKYQLIMSGNRTELVDDRLGRSYISCDPDTVTRLVLGYDDARSAVDSERLDPSTALAAETAMALFPKVPLWRPPWDDLPA